jgi:hypothetical protein
MVIRLAVIKYYHRFGWNAAGDVSDGVVVDVSALIGAPSKVTIEQIWTSFVGCSGVLEFDATTDVGALVIPGDARYVSGLPELSVALKITQVLVLLEILL